MVVSVQYCVMATAEPLPSLGISVTVLSEPTQPAGALSVVVGGPISTVRLIACRTES